MSVPPDLSIVIPLHNEVDNVEPLHAELLAALAQTGRSAELLFVDDGSTDGTFERLRGLHERSAAEPAAPRVRVLRLRRRFGKSAALAAAFEEARGGIVFTMDGDLQDDPKEIPRFLEKLEEGYDLVSGWKRERHDPWHKVLPSRLFNRVVSCVSGVRMHDFNCGFKAYRAEVVRELTLYGDLHRFVPVLAHAKGFRVGEIVVQHRPRTHGRSKYGVKRLFTGFLDLLTVLLVTSYASRPLHLFGGIGLLGFGAGVGINVYLAILWLAGERPIGQRPLLTAGVLLMILGIQLISLGLIGEMIVSRHEGRRRTYSVAERLD
ncbi:MAG TPA: glycosyltransferase family 2 protein [Planctomycetota bacterium]|nr:glycosyltransferase family 2 protein [Planctomycetota bacterium]